MGVPSQARTILSNMVTSLYAEGVVEYQALTSAHNAQPRTYGSWTAITGARAQEFTNRQEMDRATGIWYFVQECELRIPFGAGVLLTVRNRVRTTPPTGVDTAAQVWSVEKEIMCAAGAVTSYKLSRRERLYSDSRDGGGV